MSAVLPIYARLDLMFERGEGAYLFATNGKKYLDFASGIAVNCLGHCHPHLVDAMQDQAAKLWHTSNIVQIEGLEELAQRIADHSFADKIFFCNSGGEAVECGLKMIRKYHDFKGNPDRFRVITFEGCFHGRTLATISASKKPKVMEGFEPAIDGFDVVAFNDLEAVKAAITPETGGILLEPIIGEGGIKAVSQEFIEGLRKICDEQDLLLFFDEIQTGIARTGKFFAYEHYDVAPDILSSAKGIGGGFPMGACLATDNVAQAMTISSHGSTYGGNPMAMRIGNAVMDIVLADGFIENVAKLGDYFKQKLEQLIAQYPNVLTKYRGTGLLVGIQINAEKLNMESKDFVALLRKKQLLCVGAAENVVRLFPPLNITKDELDEGIGKIKALCEELSQND